MYCHIDGDIANNPDLAAFGIFFYSLLEALLSTMILLKNMNFWNRFVLQ